jgi:hypothetical protein
MQLQLDRELPVRVKCPGCQTLFTVGGPAAASDGRSRRAGVSPVGVQATPPPGAPLPEDQPLVQVRRPRHSGTNWPLIVVVGLIMAVAAGIFTFLLTRGDKGATGEDRDGAQKKSAPLGDGPRLKVINKRQQAIHQATQRGVAYLKKQILDGTNDYYFYDPGASSRIGVLALAGLTLLECEESTSSPAVQKVVDVVRGESLKPEFRFTYSIALAILFLDRWYGSKERVPEPRDRDLIQRLATRMIAAQHPNGGWSYYCEAIPEEKHQEILKTLNAGQTVPKREPKENERDDNSINQFCTLALWAARKHGIRTDTVLKAIEDRYRKNQNDDGSWGYRAKGKGPLRDATTCAGLIGLAVGHGVDKLKEEEDAKKHIGPKGGKFKKEIDVVREDPAIVKGLAYIGKRIGVKIRVDDKLRRIRRDHTEEMMKLFRDWHHAEGEDQREAIKRQVEKLDDASRLKGTYFNSDSWGDLYFLWSVERTAEIFGLRTIDGKDWYNWGVDIILKHQEEDGAWRDRFPGVCDTCFALLFLRRANIVKDLTDKLRTVRAAPGVGAASPPRRPLPALPLRRPEDA